ncbi:hypothetical protein KP509_13G098400 [Ceratopteris richardii]|nr:hypothetical protein KP509_13G098400 [Ceratopteris richardii]
MFYATCAKYYSWNRPRFRLQMAEQRFYSQVMESDFDAIKSVESQNDDLRSLREASLVTHLSGMGSPFLGNYGVSKEPLPLQVVKSGFFASQQGELLSKGCNNDACMSENEIESFDQLVVRTVTDTEGHDENQPQVLTSFRCSLDMADAGLLRAINITTTSCPYKSISLHLTDGLRVEASQFWKPFNLVDRPLPSIGRTDQVIISDSALFSHGCPDSLQMYRKIVNVGALTEQLNLTLNYSIGMETLNRFISATHTKCMCLPVPLFRLLTSILHHEELLKSDFLNSDELRLTKNRTLSNGFEGIVKGSDCGNGEDPSSSKVSDLVIGDVNPLQGDGKHGSEERGSISDAVNVCFNGYNDMPVCIPQSSSDLSNNFEDEITTQSKHSMEDEAYSSIGVIAEHHAGCSDGCADLVRSVLQTYTELVGYEIGNEKESRQFTMDSAVPPCGGGTNHLEGDMVSHGVSLHLDDDYFSVHDQATDWDVKHGSVHVLQVADKICDEYTDRNEGLSTDDTGCSESSQTAVCSGIISKENVRDEQNNSEMEPLPSATWWDEDAVLLCEQDDEYNNNTDQSWQVL